MRKLFLSLVFLSVLLSIHANPGIKGIVIDQTTRKALDYAHVVLYDGDHIVEEAMTEANGSFLIQPVKPGTYSIRIHFLGYDVYMGEEFILTEQIKDLGIIPMQMLEVGLQEVEVVANKKQVIYKLDKKIIEASSNLLSSGGTAVDILENTPSIRVNAEGEVTFRGSSGFTVYVDGKPSIFTGTQALEQIPSGQIQNIEIIIFIQRLFKPFFSIIGNLNLKSAKLQIIFLQFCNRFFIFYDQYFTHELVPPDIFL